jgi:sugar (pentulose or hexulose) kinase
VGLRQCRHLGRGRFLGGWTSAAGTAIDWVEDVTAAGEPLELLPPGSGGLLALAHLRGERAPIWDDQARGVLVGLTATTTAGDIRRAMVDAVALSALDLADRLGGLGHRPERWRATGGGFRRAALGAAISDALGQEIDVAELGDGRAAARSAADLVGLMLPPPAVTTLVPDPARHERFRALAALRAGLAELLAPTSHALAAFGSPSPHHLQGPLP